MKLIGIDSGLLRTGWGVIEVSNNQLRYISCGVIKAPASDSMAKRLAFIAHELGVVIASFNPVMAAVEETFANQNPVSTLKLGMARGAALLTLAGQGLEVFEYAPNTIKKALVGRGHAGKDQVAHMVAMLLPQAPRGILSDATDALAAAICHAHHHQILDKTVNARHIGSR